MSKDFEESAPTRSSYAGVASRLSQYLVAPSATATSERELIDRICGFGRVEIVRTFAPIGMLGPQVAPPVAVVRTDAEGAASLARGLGAAAVVERDELLLAAALTNAAEAARHAIAPPASGVGFTVDIQVTGSRDEPVPDAMVQLVGRSFTTQALTGSDGTAKLTLAGETAGSVAELRIEPRKGYWGSRIFEPELRPGRDNIVVLRAIDNQTGRGWAERAMRFDRLPTHCRGSGARVAVIDTGVAKEHRQLEALSHGSSGTSAEWSNDATGHGTFCAGLIAARENAETRFCGYAPDAEMHVFRLPDVPRSSDLLAALAYCIEAEVEIACLGYGCRRGSLIVERWLEAAKQHGVAIIAAAGNTGGPVQFPASSRHVLAVAGLGYGIADPAHPDDLALPVLNRGSNYYVPGFSCKGYELDVCAPAVGIVSCQAPNGYAVRDGTSLAAAHIAALAALILAHHQDFRTGFAARNGGRVERLFQILKASAQPISDVALTGAGLPDATVALDIVPQHTVRDGLEEMVHAMRCAGLYPGRDPAGGSSSRREPARGPADIAQWPLRPAFVLEEQLHPIRNASLHDLAEALRAAGLDGGI